MNKPDQKKRVKDREFFKIYQRVFDTHTLRLLAQTAGRGFFKTLDHPISTGKEADVFRATCSDGSFRAVKIYRIETSNFKRMSYYVEADPRFRVKHSRRALVETWCQKEFRNLRDSQAAGLRVPTPFKVSKNILLLEFIGEEGVPSPLLKDVRLSAGDVQKAVDDIAAFIKHLWKKAEIVHGDLSEFNIMVQDERLVVFDMAQAVSTKSPIARELLERDLNNLQRFAEKRGAHFDAKKALATVLS